MPASYAVLLNTLIQMMVGFMSRVREGEGGGGLVTWWEHGSDILQF